MGKPFLTEWPDVEPGELAIMVYDGERYSAFIAVDDILKTPDIWDKYREKIAYAFTRPEAS